MPFKLPPFTALPLQKDGPPYNAWGLFGPDDELGRANLIDAEAVQRGLRAAKDGKVINLNLPLDFQPLFRGRQAAEHTIFAHVDFNDDAVSFNTQCGTQWDGLRHDGYKDWPVKGQVGFYNGQTLKDTGDPANKRFGIDQFAKHPITSRAHLLDIPLYLARHNLPPLKPLEISAPVTLDMLKAAAEEFNVEFAQGDILIVRIGLTEVLEPMSTEDRLKLGDYPWTFNGVEPSIESLQWHWDNGIAAVVSDALAYEVFLGPVPQLFHAIGLGGWGMSIGELFDLRELAKECEKAKRWTFLFTSMPLNIRGGIASPANAQAIL